MPNKVAPSSQRVEPDPAGIAARVQEVVLVEGSPIGVNVDRSQRTGGFVLESGVIGYEAGVQGLRMAVNRASGLVTTYG